MSRHPRGAEQPIPFRSLASELASGRGKDAADWFGPEGGRDSFVVQVTGGAAYGVLLNDTIFVGFRGTGGRSDWSINLFGLNKTGPSRCPPNDYDGRHVFDNSNGMRGFFHAGFYRVSQSLATALNDEIRALRDIYKKKSNNYPKVILCGHSLGGALALLCGQEIDHQAVYSFGMPRVCSGDLVSILPPCHFRYVIQGDPVPSTPFESLGFAHDMPSLKLNPYEYSQRPNLISKIKRGFSGGETIIGSIGVAAKLIFASEHDMELYVETVMAV